MLNNEQQKYFDDIVSRIIQNHKEGDFDSNYILITGKAGTGKSYLAASLVKYFQDNPVSNYGIQCTALTHKALNELKKKLASTSVNLNDINGVSTVHSYFNIKASINFTTGKEEFKIQQHSKQPKKCSILFIDEVSMLDEELFKLIETQRHLYSSVILVGDEFQVPPVNDSNYNLFQDPNIHKYKLNSIVRQAEGNPVIMLASEIVQKIETKDYKVPSFCIRKIIEYSKKPGNQIVVTDNRGDFLQEYYNYVKEDIGKPLQNSNFTKSFMTTFTNKTVDSFNYIAKCIYKQSNKVNYIDVGDLLVLQAPAFDPYIDDTIIAQNNSDYVVEKLEEDTYDGIPIYVAYNSDNFIRIVKPESVNLFEMKLEKMAKDAKIDGRLWKNYYNFKNKFTEVKQCFACTTHKAQGSTVDRVFVDLKDLPWSQDIDLAFRLCYVALTRTSDVVVVMY